MRDNNFKIGLKFKWIVSPRKGIDLIRILIDFNDFDLKRESGDYTKMKHFIRDLFREFFQQPIYMIWDFWETASFKYLDKYNIKAEYNIIRPLIIFGKKEKHLNQVIIEQYDQIYRVLNYDWDATPKYFFNGKNANQAYFVRKHFNFDELMLGEYKSFMKKNLQKIFYSSRKIEQLVCFGAEEYPNLMSLTTRKYSEEEIRKKVENLHEKNPDIEFI